jgi:hypothetical protein
MLGGGVSPNLDLLMIDEPVLCRRARYPLYLLDVELRNGIRDVRYGRSWDDGDDARNDGNGIGDGDGISVWNDDAESIWVFWIRESISNVL